MGIAELRAERDLVLPELISRMWGNGGFHIDTDSIDLTTESDAHQMEWLARVVAGFVLRERETHSAAAAALDAKLETVDDAVCDLFMDAHSYAAPDRLVPLHRRLDRIIDALREIRPGGPAPSLPAVDASETTR